MSREEGGVPAPHGSQNKSTREDPGSVDFQEREREGKKSSAIPPQDPPRPLPLVPPPFRDLVVSCVLSEDVQLVPKL